jgi:light-regulated signal transduction histidine kinase (bacteriophytochrome)
MIAGSGGLPSVGITNDPLPQVSMHQVHLEQLFQNLSDNGIGIAPEYSTKIFGLFKRLNSTEQYEGTGIVSQSAARSCSLWKTHLGGVQTRPGLVFLLRLPGRNERR